MQRIALAIVSALVIAFLALIFWSQGGSEKFQPPIEIVLPEHLAGVVCATQKPNSQEDSSKVARFEVMPDGLLWVDGKTLESHRQIKLFSKASGDGALRELPSKSMFPIYSENDPASHTAFIVYWVGTAKGWEQFVISQGGRPACLGRFKLGSIN